MPWIASDLLDKQMEEQEVAFEAKPLFADHDLRPFRSQPEY